MSYVPVPATTVARPRSRSTAVSQSANFSPSVQRRRLARRAADDEPVRAVVDEERRELAETVEVDAAVRAERRRDRGEDFAEDHVILRFDAGRDSRSRAHIRSRA